MAQKQRKTWARGSGWKVNSWRPAETLYPLPPYIATDATPAAGSSMMREQVPSECYAAAYNEKARLTGGRAAVEGEVDYTPQATEFHEALSAILGTKVVFYNQEQGARHVAGRRRCHVCLSACTAGRYQERLRWRRECMSQSSRREKKDHAFWRASHMGATIGGGANGNSQSSQAL
jgi:hypothetical protein